MEIVRGRSVLKRTAVGRLQYYEKEEPSVVRRQVEDTERELSRYERALEQAEKELEALYERALGEAGADSAAVFMGHRMLLKDEEYRNSVTRAITGERVNAAFAVETVGDELCRLFLEMEDEYLRARAADIRDVSDRLLRILEEEEKGGGRCGRGPALSEPVILAARDLAPSETVLLDKKKILGFVTEQGSANSHTAILARTMEIPALVSVPVAREWDGRLAAIDGEEGILYVDPDPETLERLKEKKARQEEAARLLLEIRDLTCGYLGDAPLFSRLDLTACRGQIIGVTGPVACGKSTLGKAFLCEQPYGGSIRLDGRELAELPPWERTGLVGYLGHDPELFSGTIRENVLLGDTGDPMDYLRAVCLDGEVAAMTEGLETRVGTGGVRLSGGQAQRLALARTLAHQRPLLILDDPFSALDRATETELFAHLRRLASDSVVILISHRLYLFPELDRVIWLENGEAKVGTHEELVGNTPDYAAQFDAQRGEQP